LDDLTSLFEYHKKIYEISLSVAEKVVSNFEKVAPKHNFQIQRFLQKFMALRNQYIFLIIPYKNFIEIF